MPYTTTTYTLDTTKLDQLIRESPGKVADIVTKTANRILEQAKMITPRDPQRPPEDPGAYKPSGMLRANSNVVKQDTLGLVQYIEYYQEYALYQELGFVASNGRMVGPRPYLTPSVEKAAEQFVKDLEEVLK